jgi:hypothetical protein
MTIDIPERIKVLWFLPTHGDSRYLGTAEGGRSVDLPYLTQIAKAADNLGYYGVLLPTERSCEDSWVVASALAPLTERLRFLVAVRPGLQSPTLAARMTATLDRISNGRLLINVVTGGDPKENGGDGIFLSHAERYEVTQEFLQIYKRVLAGETIEHTGKHFRIEDGRLLFPPVQQPYPPLYFGGSSKEGTAVAAEEVDKYLTWGEPPLLHTPTVTSWLGVPVIAWIFVVAGMLMIACLLRRPASTVRAHHILPFILGSLASVGFGIMLAGLGGSAHFSVIDSYFLPAVAAAIIAGNLTSTNALPAAGFLALLIVAADTALVELGAGYATRICALVACLVFGEVIGVHRAR